MKLYVINLDRSKDRFNRIKNRFQNQGLILNRISAIDKDIFTDYEYLNLIKNQTWKHKMTRGEVACFLSHRLAIENIVKEDIFYAAIFEDDAIISRYAHYFLSSENWIPKDIDILKIETQKKKVWIGPPKKTIRNFSISRLKNNHILTGGYIINKNSAKFILEKMKDISVPIDHFLFDFDYGISNNIRIFQLDPAIVIQEESTSLLNLERIEERTKNRKKYSFLKIIFREIKRFFTKIYFGIRGLYINIKGKDKWKHIDFV